MARHKTYQEPTLPSRWGKSRSGTSHFYVIHTSERDHQGRCLYRLRYLAWDVRGGRLWTAEELLASVRWLKNKPTRKSLARDKGMRVR